MEKTLSTAVAMCMYKKVMRLRLLDKWNTNQALNDNLNNISEYRVQFKNDVDKVNSYWPKPFAGKKD